MITKEGNSGPREGANNHNKDGEFETAKHAKHAKRPRDGVFDRINERESRGNRFFHNS